MNRLLALLSASSLLLSACASMYGTPEARLAENSRLPDYTLCEKLAVATLAPPEIRAEWAAELQRRGTDCRQFQPMLDNAVRQNQELMNRGLQTMQQPQSTPSSITCHKVREWDSGINKNCVYNCVGSEAVQTISRGAICPLTIVR